MYDDGKVEYHEPRTMVRWAAMKSGKEPLANFGRVMSTGGDPVQMPDGRWAHIEGWRDEAMRLRAEAVVTLALVSDLMDVGSHVIHHGDAIGDAVGNKENCPVGVHPVTNRNDRCPACAVLMRADAVLGKVVAK